MLFANYKAERERRNKKKEKSFVRKDLVKIISVVFGLVFKLIELQPKDMVGETNVSLLVI